MSFVECILSNFTVEIISTFPEVYFFDWIIEKVYWAVGKAINLLQQLALDHFLKNIRFIGIQLIGM